MGSLVSFTISKHINKEYLKDAIQEWQAHKNTVERKIKEADSNEKKQELTKYLNEVNENLAILEKKYESIKDMWGDSVPRYYLKDIQDDEVIVVDRKKIY